MYGSEGGRILRAAVVGSGRISEEHLRFLSQSPLAELSGVCDLSPSLAEYGAERFPAAGGRRAAVFTDVQQMLSELRPDVVHVLTPAHTHPLLATQALDAGAHAIVEKPIAPTNAQFRALWQHARAVGLQIVEDHNYRFNAPILEIERLLAAGELGEVREVDVRMCLGVRDPGGRYGDRNLRHPSHDLPASALHEFITHLCYLALRFVPPDAEPWRVTATWSKHGIEEHWRYDDLDALVIAGKVHARLRFTSHALPEGFTVAVRGTRGWAETDLFQPYVRTVVPRRLGGQLSPLINHFVNGASLMGASLVGLRNRIMQRTPYEGLHLFLAQTYAALGRGAEPPVTYDDMDRASRLVDALLDEANRA